jgi:hypothetical protein
MQAKAHNKIMGKPLPGQKIRLVAEIRTGKAGIITAQLLGKADPHDPAAVHLRMFKIMATGATPSRGNSGIAPGARQGAGFTGRKSGTRRSRVCHSSLPLHDRTLLKLK